MAATAQVPHKSETVTINGKNLYYEVYGEGEPLFLFHGGFMSSRAWLPYVDDYDDDFQVYLVDLPGHGRSYPFGENPSLKDAAKDVLALLDYLKVDSINAIGYSYGGFMLYEIAKLNPTMVEAFIPIGACGKIEVNDDFKEEFFKMANELTKAYQITPQHIEGINRFASSNHHETSNEELQKIKSKVLIVFGDDDFALNWSELVRARQHLPNSNLWIVPNMGHGAHEYANKERFIEVSKAFLSSN